MLDLCKIEGKTGTVKGGGLMGQGKWGLVVSDDPLARSGLLPSLLPVVCHATCHRTQGAGLQGLYASSLFRQVMIHQPCVVGCAGHVNVTFACTPVRFVCEPGTASRVSECSAVLGLVSLGGVEGTPVGQGAVCGTCSSHRRG